MWSRPVCSPHPRGWFRGRDLGAEHVELLPASAGRAPRGRPRIRSPAPCTEGWVPPLSPARSLITDTPHSREDGPGAAGRRGLLPASTGMVPYRYVTIRPRWFSTPHPRGWSQEGRRHAEREHLLPTPAGTVPPRTLRRPARSATPCTRGYAPLEMVSGVFPRTRGDGPRVTGYGRSGSTAPRPGAVFGPVADAGKLRASCGSGRRLHDRPHPTV